MYILIGIALFSAVIALYYTFTIIVELVIPLVVFVGSGYYDEWALIATVYVFWAVLVCTSMYIVLGRADAARKYVVYETSSHR